MKATQWLLDMKDTKRHERPTIIEHCVGTIESRAAVP
jgi:hypothetical protein